MTSEKAALVDDVEAGGRGGGDATFGMTVITLMKICVGTGVLAVPHAFSGAGVVPGFGMLFALLCWNDWSANRLLACRDLLSDDERRRFEAPGGEVAASEHWRAVAGPRVATSVEVCLCVLMFGVATAYFVALHDFLAATPLGPALARAPGASTRSRAACLALPLSLVDDIGALAYAGAAGLCAIFVSFACIVTYGVEERTAVGWAQADGFTWMTPTSVSALASGFGVLAFASAAAAARVAFLAYAATGAGVARLYDGLPCAPDGVAGNVLDDLPRGAPWTTGAGRRGRDVRGLALSRRPSAS
ncbi:cullin-like protein [Aureococcus anophagefferens]|uniref:Cullin-like protein n=1 Tax=Aureococcus anophagefferens TaxID=44056 RepID=A0ABR1GFD3_AURAN